MTIDGMPDEELPFVSAILGEPQDCAAPLVYADWLEERGDPRAQFIRAWSELTADVLGPDAQQRLLRLRELRRHAAPQWRAVFGDYFRAAGAEDSLTERIEQVAAILKRPVQFVARDGYTQEIVGAAIHPLGQTVAYVERRSRTISEHHVDIDYFLRAHAIGQTDPGTPIESYNPYFGCDVGFCEWYGGEAVVIYREKHETYVARFGVAQRPVFQTIEDDWAVDGPYLCYRGYREQQVRRCRLPAFDQLPTLSAEEAASWQFSLRTAPTPEQALMERIFGSGIGDDDAPP